MTLSSLRIIATPGDIPAVPADWKPEDTLANLERRRAHREAERAMRSGSRAQ